MTAPALSIPGPLLLVGAGKMGGALLQGWLALGLEPSQIHVLDPHPSEDMRQELEQRGIALNSEHIPTPGIVLLAVKPQLLKPALEAVAPYVGKSTLVISILAGITLSALEAGLPEGAAVIRTMPNTPSAVGRGVTVLIANSVVTEDQRALAGSLMQAVGTTAWIGDEALMDAVTAVSGSGPAYVFHLVEAMTKAGVTAGLPAELAAQLARATVCGAGELMHRSDLDPATLRENVTSKGGTTAAALAVLMGEGGLTPLMERAVQAAAERSRELGRG